MHKIYCFGFLFFSKNTIRKFFVNEKTTLVFVSSAKTAINKGFNRRSGIASWGKRGEQEAQILSAQFDVDIWRVEDGFIRSAGLGSDYSPPVSLVIDKTGIYYDPSKPSDLEILLQTDDFEEQLITRSAKVQQRLVEQSISKYNLGSSIDTPIVQLIKEKTQDRLDKRVLLIPGQVEDDASIQKGTRDVQTNTDLIIKVRSLHPEAFLIFKPHPDVVSGNRIGHVKNSIIEKYCDTMLEDVSITDCLEIADEVHTMTSLVGIEALMRDCKVSCYGLPFYAGWGLTEDQYRVGEIDRSDSGKARRTRQLSLHQLIAATYILYPRYINWETEQYDTPEHAIDWISRNIQEQGGKQLNKVSRARRQIRKLINMGRGYLKGL